MPLVILLELDAGLLPIKPLNIPIQDISKSPGIGEPGVILRKSYISKSIVPTS